MKEFIATNQKLSQGMFAVLIFLIGEIITLIFINFIFCEEFFEKCIISSTPLSSKLVFFWLVMYLIVTKIWFKVFNLDTKEKKYDYLVGVGAIIGVYFLLVLSSLHFLL